MRGNLIGSVSLVGLSCVTFPAMAVTAAAPAAQKTAAVPTAVNPSLPDESEITVTALRSNTSIQRTPAAVTIVSGDVIARQQIIDVRGIQGLVPSARFSAANTSTRIFIRGVGSALDFYWIPETTAVNIDGSYVPRFATAGAFFDIDSVQVLPGPQGVLYGRSAGGGAVVITTRKPVLGLSEMSAALQYGNYNTVHGEVVGNTPLTDQIALRIGGVYNSHDGYEPYGLQSDNSFGVKASLLYKPAGNASILIWGNHFEQTGLPTAAQYVPLQKGVSPWFIPPVDPVTGRDNTRGSRNDYKYSIAGYTVHLDLGVAAIDYTGSILHQTEVSLRKLIGNDQIQNNAQTQFVQNFHLSGSSGSLDWIGGVDWLYAKSRFNSQLGPNRLGSIFPDIRQRSVSGFGQGTLHLGDSVRLVAGARYTRDSLSLHGTSIRCFGPCVFPPVNFDQSWKHLDLKGGIEADLAPHLLAYVNVQTGYAPGTLNVVVADNVTPPAGVGRQISPQTLLAYTAGLKSTLGDGLLTLNVEGYHYSYRKLIIQSFVASLNQQTLFNAPRATVYGIQLTSALHPTRNDTLSVNVAYSHGRYGTFVATPGAPDIGGLQMVFTPDYTGTASYDHRFDLAGGANLDLRASTYVTSSFWGTFAHTASTQQGSYIKSDASITYHSPDDRWSLGAWIKNIENKAVASSITSSGYAAPFAGAAFLEPPRTYGLSFGIKI
ncbi:TonB-dependent receptor [Sphingomonas sp.]|uniref:TonB-dependent receptor n=1 Tax=Sphingomonas sp. TaxID=28214 RepID=UPI0025D01DBF|nr:TonB-dependent receptor [Sphingomonas sp.]